MLNTVINKKLQMVLIVFIMFTFYLVFTGKNLCIISIELKAHQFFPIREKKIFTMFTFYLLLEYFLYIRNITLLKNLSCILQLNTNCK